MSGKSKANRDVDRDLLKQAKKDMKDVIAKAQALGVPGGDLAAEDYRDAKSDIKKANKMLKDGDPSVKKIGKILDRIDQAICHLFLANISLMPLPTIDMSRGAPKTGLSQVPREALWRVGFCGRVC